MKKALCYLGCALCTWSGLWVALIAAISDDSPLAQGGMSIAAALLFCAAILIAGYGNSLKWRNRDV